MVGLLGVTVAMVSIGLAIVALDDNQEVTILAWIPFAIAAMFGFLFGATWVYLSRHAAAVARKVKAVRDHIGYGLRLRTWILNNGFKDGAQAEQAAEEWHKSVALWLKNEEPDYISDFEIAAPGIMPRMMVFSLDTKSSLVVHVVDAKLGALRTSG
jgi:hypothetical protein